MSSSGTASRDYPDNLNRRRDDRRLRHANCYNKQAAYLGFDRKLLRTLRIFHVSCPTGFVLSKAVQVEISIHTFETTMLSPHGCPISNLVEHTAEHDAFKTMTNSKHCVHFSGTVNVGDQLILYQKLSRVALEALRASIAISALTIAIAPSQAKSAVPMNWNESERQMLLTLGCSRPVLTECTSPLRDWFARISGSML